MARAYKRKLELDFIHEDGDRKRVKIQEKLDYLDRTIGFMFDEIEKGNQTIINLTGDNAEKKRDIEILTGQLNESKQETERANNLIQSLNDKLTTLQDLQDETQVENTDLNNQITDLKEQINNATSERDHYQGLSDEAQIRINELSQQIDENNTKIAALDKQTKLINAQLTSAQQERDSLREELDNITGEFETLKTNYSAVQSENETLKDTYNKLKKDYSTIQKANEANERLSQRYLEQYNDSQSSIANLKEQNALLVKQRSKLDQNIKELKNNEKLRDSLIADLEKQKEGYEGKMEQATTELMDLRGKLTRVSGELSNKETEYQQKLDALNARLQQKARDDINKLNMKQADERAKLENNIRKLQEKLETANTSQALALERAKREEMIKLQNLEDKYTTAHSKLYREYSTQQEQLKAAIEEKRKLEREIAKNEKILAQLEASKNELKDARMQAQELKRKWGDSVQLQKDIASLEEQKIQLEADKKTYKKELEALKKAQQQLNSRLPRGIPKSIPSSLEIPPSLGTAPRPPPTRQNAPQATTYNPPQPAYFPKWPENPNKLTLEIKVVGAEGGAKAGLDSNLSPVSKPKGDIISKLPFESYGIDIFQPEKFRKMDTKPDKNKEKKQLSPYQVARSIGNSLFRNLDPVRIRRTNVGVDNTYYAIEKTPELFETFSRSARKNKVTRIY